MTHIQMFLNELIGSLKYYYNSVSVLIMLQDIIINKYIEKS